jgi:hypothetical protein
MDVDAGHYQEDGEQMACRRLQPAKTDIAVVRRDHDADPIRVKGF